MQVDSNVSEADHRRRARRAGCLLRRPSLPGPHLPRPVRQSRRGPITVQNIVTYDVVVAFLASARVIGQRLADTAQLFVATGGGWWDAPDLAARRDAN